VSASLELDRGFWFLVVRESDTRHPVPVTGLLFARDIRRAKAMPCIKTRQDMILFFAAQRFSLKTFTAKMENGKWRIGFAPIFHFPLSILAAQTL
jgi:hypothetical protein